jgi:hypothetical protein
MVFLRAKIHINNHDYNHMPKVEEERVSEEDMISNKSNYEDDTHQTSILKDESNQQEKLASSTSISPQTPYRTH